MRILYIYDYINNGKSWSNQILIPTTKINYLNCTGNERYDIYIFSFNEDSLFGPTDFNKLLFLRNKYSKLPCKIINDPIYYKIFRSKWDFYQQIKNHKLNLNIALTKKINNKNTLGNSDFPCIISVPVQAGGKGRRYCKDISTVPQNLSNLIYIKFIESKLFDYYFCGRICAVNDKIIYYFPRFAKSWNVSVHNQVFNRDLISKGYKFMKDHHDELQRMVIELFKLFKNCFYVADVIYNNGWYICEVGFKFAPNMYLKKLSTVDTPFKITVNEYYQKVKQEI